MLDNERIVSEDQELANFNTHFASSVMFGAAYGAAGHVGYDMPIPASIMAGGLVTLGGLLPDVDSDNAVILRELLALVAAIVPAMLLDRFRLLGVANETIVLSFAAIYILIRFVAGSLLRRITIHRGMWHSLPAAAIAGLVVYVLCECPDETIRMFKTGAISTGYLWHLILDEINSVDSASGRVRIKRSFGTAFKFFGKGAVGNVMVYGLLLLLASFVTMHDQPVPGAAPNGYPYQQPTMEMTPVPPYGSQPPAGYSAPSGPYPTGGYPSGQPPAGYIAPPR